MRFPRLARLQAIDTAPELRIHLPPWVIHHAHLHPALHPLDPLDRLHELLGRFMSWRGRRTAEDERSVGLAVVVDGELERDRPRRVARRRIELQRRLPQRDRVSLADEEIAARWLGPKPPRGRRLFHERDRKSVV